MKKKMLLIPLLIFMAANPAYASFSDIPASDVNNDYRAVEWLQTQEVIQGYPDGTFRPDQNINRAEFLKMLYETIGMEVNSQVLPFPDVPQDAWYAKYVAEAYATAVVNGYPDGYFRPENDINYAEAVKIVTEAFFDFEYVNESSTYQSCYADLSYLDVADAWYWKYIKFADTLCIIPDAPLTGLYGFDPSWPVTRLMMADLIYRSKTAKDNGNVKYSKDLIPLNINK